MFNFRQEISTIQQEIRMLNQNLHQTLADNAVPRPPTSVSGESSVNSTKKPPKELRGNEYSLRQLQYQQQRLNYRKKMRKESLQRGREESDTADSKQQEVTLLSSTEAVDAWLQENDYKKKWYRLDAYQKKKKLEEFTTKCPEVAATWSVDVEELCSKDVPVVLLNL